MTFYYSIQVCLVCGGRCGGGEGGQCEVTYMSCTHTFLWVYMCRVRVRVSIGVYVRVYVRVCGPGLLSLLAMALPIGHRVWAASGCVWRWGMLFPTACFCPIHWLSQLHVNYPLV